MDKVKNCINCGSSNINYDSAYGFYKCESCSELWAYSKDDPDWEDAEVNDPLIKAFLNPDVSNEST